MIFEFAGVDGSGKSTLIGAVRRRINEAGSAFAYERSFQSEGVRLLEAVASAEGRKRPVGVFGREIVEHVRCVDLVRRSFDLHPYAGSTSQHVLTDSYIVEQLGRLIQFGCCSPGLMDAISAPLAWLHCPPVLVSASTLCAAADSTPAGLCSVLLRAAPLSARCPLSCARDHDRACAARATHSRRSLHCALS